MRNPSYLEVSRHRVFYFRWPLIRPCYPQPNSNRSQNFAWYEGRLGSLVSGSTPSPSYVGQALMKQWSASGMRYDEIRAALKKHFQDALERRRSEMAAEGRLRPDRLEALQNGLALADEAILTGDDIFPHQTDDSFSSISGSGHVTDTGQT